MKAIVKTTKHADIRPGAEVEVTGLVARVNGSFIDPANTNRTKKEDRDYVFDIGDLDFAPPVATGDTAKPLVLARMKRPSDTHQAITHKFDINGNKGYITCGVAEDGQPFEIFITLSKTGGTLGGITNCVARAFSLLLQMGMPLEEMVRKFEWHKFEPAGPTSHPQIKHATSVIDYIARWLGYQFIKGYNPAAPQ